MSGPRLFGAALACLVLVPSPASAQGTPAGPPVLDLWETVRLARDHSLSVGLSRQQLRGTEADRSVALAAALPSVTVSTTGNYSVLPGSNSTLGSLGVGFPQNGASVDTTLSGQQTLFDAFATRDSLRMYDLQLQEGALGVEQAEQEAMAAAASDYFDVIKDEGLAQVARDSVTEAQAHLRQGELKLGARTGTRADVLQLRATLANAVLALAQARNTVALARMTLANAVNMPVTNRPLVAAPVVPDLAVDIERELPLGVARRPETRSAIAKRDADRVKVEQQSRALWPTLAATSSYSQRDLGDGQFSAGLRLSYTVFDGFKVRNQMQSAVEAARADEISLEQTRQRLALEIRQQYQNREEAGDRIGTARAGLANAQEAYRLALRRYTAGVATSFEIFDVQNTLVTSRNNYVQALDDLRGGNLKLAKALGLDLAAYLGGTPGANRPARGTP